MEKMSSLLKGVEKKDSKTELIDDLRSNLDSINLFLDNFNSNNLSNLIEISTEALRISEIYLLDNKKNDTDEKEVIFLDQIHSLKNYFSAIYSFCDFIKNGETKGEDDVQELIGHMKKAVLKSYDVLSNIENNYSKEIIDVDIKAITEEIIKEFNIQSLKKNITIKNNIDNLNIKTDISILSSSIENLISNAVKFSKQNGLIEIWSRRKDKYAQIFIKDDGIGISKERLNNFFDQKNTSSGTNGEIGTGVGMYASKSQIRSIGGDIEVESEEGKGSTFILTVPA